MDATLSSPRKVGRGSRARQQQRVEIPRDPVAELHRDDGVDRRIGALEELQRDVLHSRDGA